MENHLFHLIVSVTPFLAILTWLFKHQSLISFSRVGMIIVVCLIVSLQTVPIHYFHAIHLDLSQQKHDCCLPVPTVLSPVFNLNIPLQKENTPYLLKTSKALSPIFYSFNNRAPPVS